VDLGKYQTGLCNNREIPSAIIGIFIIQETEGALIAPKKYDTINYQDYVLY